MKKHLAALALGAALMGSYAIAQGIMLPCDISPKCADQAACDATKTDSLSESHMEWLLCEAQMSEEQKIKVQKLRQELEQKIAALHPNVSISAYLDTKNFDAKTYIKNETKYSLKIVELRAEYFGKIYNVLTPEQKRKVMNAIRDEVTGLSYQ
jgi:Spy/CpxP family protein refolding chaperone